MIVFFVRTFSGMAHTCMSMTCMRVSSSRSRAFSSAKLASLVSVPYCMGREKGATRAHNGSLQPVGLPELDTAAGHDKPAATTLHPAISHHR